VGATQPGGVEALIGRRPGPDDVFHRAAVDGLRLRATQDRLDAGDLTEDEDITRVYYLLTSALAAVEETMKFIPPDADSVPEGAFWSQAGRLVFESAPERFGRARLDQQREQLRERVVEFEDKYGTEDEEADA